MGFGELTEMCGQSVLCQDWQCSDTEFIFISRENLVLLHVSVHDLILPAKGQGVLVKGLSGGHDGVKQGFANEALAELADNLSIPVIASGGAGTMEHFKDAFVKGKADAALAASVFHFGEISIPELKDYLWQQGINVRR